MADEAFALSPIHARASLPTDGDYDAICEAFMETSRGRWFLTEYAKRNRNTDTRMVLEAIERLEQNLASQKQAQADAQIQAEAPVEAAPKVDLWPELAKAFTKTRIEIAQRLVREGNEEAFEAIRSSAETIKSVSWALRERGFDAKICDFFDVQVNAITDGYTGLLAESSVAGEIESDVLAAFDALIAHVEALTSTSDAETAALDAVVDAVADAMNEDEAIAEDEPPTAAMADNEPQATAETAAPIETAPVETAQAEIVSTVEVIPAPDADAAFRQIYGDEGDIEFIDVAAVDAPPPAPTEPEINRQRLFEAKVEPYRPAPIAATEQAQHALADDFEIVDAAPEPLAAAAAHEMHTPAAPLPQPAPQERIPEQPQAATSEAATQASSGGASLGQALLASGVIANPAGRPDPLAPFRRMSQAEKIAFFT